MRMDSHQVHFEPIPIVTKTLITINVALFILEVILYPLLNIDLVSNYCLSPARIINEFETSAYTINGISSLFLSNIFHLNPWTSGAMGIMHIIMNMMALLSIGKVLEKQFGSFVFLIIAFILFLFVGPLQIPIAILLESITMNAVPLLSTHQCGVGYSAVLFGLFMIYLRIIPNSFISFCGFQVKKWLVPFIELLLLSILLRASFIGHLSGIIIGLLYVTGIPGFFIWRQIFIKNIENIFCIKFISNRKDYISTPTQPKINAFKPSFSCLNTNSNDENVEEVSDASDAETDRDFDETDGLIAL